MLFSLENIRGGFIYRCFQPTLKKFCNEKNVLFYHPVAGIYER